MHARIIAQPFPHWIPPNVTGDVFNYFLRPQNMIVVPHLPEPLATALLEFIARALFERVNELDQIRTLGKPFAKEVNVVRHDALGVKGEIPLRGGFQQRTAQPFSHRWIRKERRSPLRSDGHEINLAAAIVFCRTAQVLLIKRHADKATPNEPAFVEAGLQPSLVVLPPLASPPS
jgi:hypothetical protein